MIYFRDLNGKTIIVVESINVIPRIGEYVIFSNVSYEVSKITYDWPKKKILHGDIEVVTGSLIINVYVIPIV